VVPDEEHAVSAYFLSWAPTSASMAKIGYPLCRATSWQDAAMVPPLYAWKALPDNGSNPPPQDFLEINMFFDFRAIHGAEASGGAARPHRQALAAEHTVLRDYAQNALLYKPPLTFFGALPPIDRSPSSDVQRRDALRPSSAPLYALQHGRDTNTLDRLQRLLEKARSSARSATTPSAPAIT
jgi:signal-transduction protein with cAMP-binding, CBS, and nucleotidyltransferase domain